MSQEPASPPCHAHETDDLYAGYMPREELVALLTALLEAERAGAKVAEAFGVEADTPEARALLRAVQRDEGRYCALLSGACRDLGVDPGHAVGAFYEKAMAVDGFAARLAFLNRGQGWVVRKLAAALPRIRDDRLHAGLQEMHDRHVENIARCDAFLAGQGPG